MRKYSVAPSTASDGVPIHCTKRCAQTALTAPTARPQMTETVIAVWVAVPACLSSPAPMARAITTFAPVERPMKILRMRVTSEPVAPTAASEAAAASPVNLPTTMRSAALYNSCKTPVSIIGTANRKSCGSTRPFTMSIGARGRLFVIRTPSFFLTVIKYQPIYTNTSAGEVKRNGEVEKIS